MRSGTSSPLSFAAWAEVAFELADALVLMGIFRLLARDRRVAFLAVLLHVCLVSWVGQDYLSPQAFGYLLWLGIVLIYVRWLRAPARKPRGGLGRLRAPLLAGLSAPFETAPTTRILAVALASVVFFAIVAAHQLTPYMALAGIGALTLLGLVRPRWLVFPLAGIAFAYLAMRYDVVASQIGGWSSIFNPVRNASGMSSAYQARPVVATAEIVRGLAAGMWLLALAMVLRQWRTLGRMAIPVALAISPFVFLPFQSYGGEMIYRVYLFSVPWCAFLIASGLWGLRARLRRWLCISAVCAVALFAGLQGLYAQVRLNAFTHAELSASLWLYGHIPRGSLIVLPSESFPLLETAQWDTYAVRIMPASPADPEPGKGAWMDEARLAEVDYWIADDLGYRTAYVVVSRGMYYWVDFYGTPKGFVQMARELPTAPDWSVVFANADVTIYRWSLTQ